MDLGLDPHPLSDDDYHYLPADLSQGGLWLKEEENLLVSPSSSDSEEAALSPPSTDLGLEEEQMSVLCGVCKRNIVNIAQSEVPNKRRKLDEIFAHENVCADCLQLSPSDLPKFRTANPKSKRAVKREHAKRRTKETDSDAVKRLKEEQSEIATKAIPDTEKKRLQQIVRNRISAQQSRDRKKAYVDQLESEKKDLQSQNLNLLQKVERLKFENRLLKHKLAQIQTHEQPESMPFTRTVRNVTIALATVISVVALVNSMPEQASGELREALVALDLKSYKNVQGVSIQDATNQVLRSMNLSVDDYLPHVVESEVPRVLSPDESQSDSPNLLDQELYFDLSSIRSSLIDRIQDKTDTEVNFALRGSRQVCESAKELVKAYEENTLATMFCPNVRFYTNVGKQIEEMLKMVQVVVPVSNMRELVPEFQDVPENYYLELLCKVIDVNVIPAK